MNLRFYPGYVGMHTRDQARGAIPNGARIVKTMTEKGDAHPVGSLGTILGSIETPPEMQADYPGVTHFYFVEWDDSPGVAVGVRSDKIGECAHDRGTTH